MPAEEQLQIRLKQGRAIYGVDMKIVGDDGKELPWDGKAPRRPVRQGAVDRRELLQGRGRRPARWTGWFPTGDVATIDPDGYMQITDRSKDVIKSGGEWISSIDLENIAWRIRPWRWPPASACRTPSGTSGRCGGGEEARRRGRRAKSCSSFYEGKIAKWQIPDDVVFVEAIPLGATGKMLKTQAARAVQGLQAARRPERAAQPRRLSPWATARFGAVPERCRCAITLTLRCTAINLTTRRHTMTTLQAKTVRQPASRRRCAAAAAPPSRQKGETVKIACIDPLSGLIAAVGQNQLKSCQFMAEQLQQEATRPA